MPKLTEPESIVIAEMLSVIPFYPSNPSARLVIAMQIQSMCELMESAKWLVTRMSTLYSHWPGIPEMRTVYTSKFKPADGTEGGTGTAAFPDGIPPERLAAPEPDWKALPPSQLLAEILGDARASVPEVKLSAGFNETQHSKKDIKIPTEADIAEVLRKQRENQAARDAVMEALAK